MTCLTLILLYVITSMVYSQEFDVKITSFDSNGRESSLIYEGGTVDITCKYMNRCNRYVNLNVPTSPDPRYRVHYRGNHTSVTRRILVDPRFMYWPIECSCPNKAYVNFTIYILCQVRTVKPNKVCPKPNELCHMKVGSAECERLTPNSCQYSSPTFNVVCSKHRDSGPKAPAYPTQGLCYSLTDPRNPPSQFLATDARECDNEFNSYLCGSDCGVIKKQMAMSGWEFADIATPFSIFIEWSGPKGYDLVCTAASGTDTWITSRKLALTCTDLINMTEFAEQLVQLRTPAIADIVCIGTHYNVGRFQYKTTLLLFSSDKDMKYSAAREKLGNMTMRVTFSVTAATGLYVCVEEGIGNCTPINDSNSDDRETTTANMVPFYIGLFASSPKTKYVLIHNQIINVSAHLTETSYTSPTPTSVPDMINASKYETETNDTTTPMTAGKLSQNTTNEGSWKLAFFIAVIVATVSAVIATIVIATMGVAKCSTFRCRRERDDCGYGEFTVYGASPAEN